MNENILQEADRITAADRNKDYGSPFVNHSCTAALWSTWLARRFDVVLPLTATDVCFLNILQKVSRAGNSAKVKRDTIVDLAGFSRNIEMSQDEAERRNPSGLE